MPSFVLADTFIDTLIELGVVSDRTTHVIIDAKYGEIVKLHYESLETNENILKSMAAAVADARIETDA